MQIMDAQQERDLIGSRIQQARKRTGLSAREIAERSKGMFTRQQLNNWECGLAAPKKASIKMLASLLDSNAAYLSALSDVDGNLSPEWKYSIPAGVTAEETKRGMDFIALDTDAIQKHGIHPRDLRIIEVKDDTIMSLKIGDAVIVDKSKIAVDGPGLFAIRFKQDIGASQVWLRYLRPEIDGTYTLYCDDKTHYPDTNLNLTEFNQLDIIGKYAGFWHWA